MALSGTLQSAPFEHKRARAAELTLQVSGILDPFVTKTVDSKPQPTGMRSDPVNNLGFALGFSEKHRRNALAIFSLEDPVRVVAWVDTKNINFTDTDLERIAIIPELRKVIFPQKFGNVTDGPTTTCAAGGGTFLYSADYSTLMTSPPPPGTVVQLPVTSNLMPCSGNDPFAARLLSYDAGHGKLYAFGTHARDTWRDPNNLKDAGGSTLLLRQMDIRLLDRYEWQIDLRLGGCQRMLGGPALAVGRVGNTIVTYCYDDRPSRQGYAVSVPLRESGTGAGRTWEPVPTGGDPLVRDHQGTAVNATIRRTPALGEVVPLADPGSGQLVLVTSGEDWGNAIWPFDPVSERFVGVITGGVASEPEQNFAAGIDEHRGRAYVLTSKGIMLALTRTTPLDIGRIVPVLVNSTGAEKFAASPSIAVFPKLERLVIAVSGRGDRDSDDPTSADFRGGYVLIDDHFPDPPVPDPEDPDEGTEGVPEREGITEAVRAGEGVATGAHVLVPGGLTRIINHNDPFCRNDDLGGLPGQPGNFENNNLPDGQCMSEFIFTRGHREFSLAHVEVGTGFAAGGSTADAAGLAFAKTDTATGSDFRTFGLSDNGTEGPSGCGEAGGPPCDGFPVPSVHCGDFGGGPQASQQEPSPEGLPQSAAFASAVSCDAESHAATGTSASAGFALPGPLEPGFSVGRVWSQVRSFSTAEGGHHTIAEARAQDITIGPIRIAEVRTEAVTSAKGQTDSARAVFQRQWCGIEIDGEMASEGCMNPDEDAGAREVLDRVNLVLGRVRFRLTPPAAGASPGGFLAVVKKAPGFIASDSATNGDYTQTIPGLDVVFYNDGVEGVSRVVVQLANVRAETRYGVRILPQFSVPSFSSPNTPGAPPRAVSATRPSIAPQVPRAPSTQRASTPQRVLARPVGAVTQPSRQSSPFSQLLDLIPRAIREGIELLVTSPGQFAKLFMLWVLLAAGPYLIVKRRRLAADLDRLVL